MFSRMSHTTEAEYKKQLEELRELHRQAVEETTQKAHDQLTLAHNQICRSRTKENYQSRHDPDVDPTLADFIRYLLKTS